VDGLVATRGGRLSLPGFGLRIRTGELAFRPDEGLTPEVAFLGSMQRRRVEIDVTASGTLDDLRIDLSSTPDYPRESILALMTTGVLPDELTTETAGEAAAWAGARLLLDELRGSSEAKDPDEMGAFERLQYELAERVDVTTDSVPGGAEPIVAATVRILDWLELQGEKDEYGEFNLDVVIRVAGR
jgi:hypothetical protein